VSARDARHRDQHDLRSPGPADNLFPELIHTANADADRIAALPE
jgi:hypothetical protein